MILAVTIMALLIILMVSSGNKIFSSSSNSIDSAVMSKIRGGNNLSAEEKIARFKNAGTDSQLSDDQLNYGKHLTEFLFKFTKEELQNEQGILLAFFPPTKSHISSRNALFFLSSKEGVLSGYNDQVNQQVYTLISFGQIGNEYLKGKDICILPIKDDDNEDAKKVLSYATGFSNDASKGIPTKKEITDIMASNVVDQVSISSNQLKYFKGSNIFSVRFKDRENTLAYHLNGITCIFPARVWKPSHVKLVDQSGELMFKGTGQIFTGLLNHLRSKISKIKQGDFS